jgi:hypothetical protein
MSTGIVNEPHARGFTIRERLTQAVCWHGYALYFFTRRALKLLQE